MRNKTKVVALLIPLLGLTMSAIAAPGSQGIGNGRLAAGSWFGRALPDAPWCTPGGLLDPGNPSLGPCPLPREIIMLPTFFADGNFLGIASHEFNAGGGEAHGTWTPVHGGIEADWLFLEKGPDGKLVGASHMRLGGHLVGRDRLEGAINVYFFPFVGADGLAVIDPDTGRAIPDPLSAVGPVLQSGMECAPPVNGCLGVYKFVIDRIKVEP